MKALVFLLQLVGLALLGAGPVWFWDHHGPIGWHAHVLFWHPGFDLPPSLASQRDNAVRAGNLALQATQACRGQLDSQNGRVDALKAAGLAMKAENAKAVAGARAVAESARQQASAILAEKSTDPNRCRAADALILKEAGR